MRFVFLCIALVLDSIQDYAVRRYVREKTGVVYSTVFYSIVKSRAAFVWNLPMLTGPIWLSCTLCFMYGLYHEERGYWDGRS